ncbi:26s proteasome complex ubiquitin receptor subunit rpn13 protein [Lasallia pustulata]|uniref:26s proteasome complex ubiquitin receptor subunit rpn13 protein n=1 Tax=Lasallia pustulata TaxID=136370 RepID=A0A1W5CX38_9LECA|nr:26s proteasome complex ubiquitin receptor subunit rpn13 protein [Lasallia pustulata]
MSISPIITFKAGACDLDSDSSPYKVLPKATPGYIYLYSEDDLVRFCWRPRSALLEQPELELVMVPTDGHFVPYEHNEPNSPSKSPTNGRVFVLKFSSSSQRHLFWLQSKTQHARGDPSWFSPRDLKLGQIVDQLLQGDEVDVQQEMGNIPSYPGGQDGDDDETMEDVEGTGAGTEHHRQGSGGAGADATGGDIREEGEGPREGGADGGRAAAVSGNEAAAAVQSFLRSLQGSQALGNQQITAQGKSFTTLPDLLPSATTIPVIESADPAFVDKLLTHVPPALLLLAQEVDDLSSAEPNSETARAAIEALSFDQKKDILKKVLRSPQFSQSLGSLTMALRDGGLPSISDALKVKVENGGFMRRGGMPLGGGEAIEAFLTGIRAAVEEDEEAADSGTMDTS